MEGPQAQPDSKKSEFEVEEFWPLSGKPYFSVILTKSNVWRSYNLALPVKMQPVFPSNLVPVILTYCGKNWEMVYYGDRPGGRFDAGWKPFVIDNGLKIGDACVFELEECSSTIIKLRVQILRGDFPPELLGRVNGETKDTPIILDE